MNMTVGDKIQVGLFGTNPEVLVILHSDHGEGDAVWRECCARGTEDFTLAEIQGVNWENDLSPWGAPPMFRNAPPFGGEADRYLGELTQKILPMIRAAVGIVPGAEPKRTYIAGYSLAGLFALYSAYRTDAFDGVVSASGSMWYPDFLEYVQENAISERVGKTYFSLGDKEANTRNPVMCKVEEYTRIIHELMLSRGRESQFELNEGGHFKDDAIRLAKGICWMLEA